MSDPNVADAAVVGVPDVIFGEMAVAFVEAKDGSRPTPATILHHIRNLLAGYKKPKHVFIVDALPRNSLGKVLKVELRERATHLVPTVKGQ